MFFTVFHTLHHPSVIQHATVRYWKHGLDHTLTWEVGTGWNGRHFAGSCHGRPTDLDLSGTGLYTSLKARPQNTTLNHTDQHLFQNSFAMLSCIRISYPLSKTLTSSLNHKRTKRNALYKLSSQTD